MMFIKILSPLTYGIHPWNIFNISKNNGEKGISAQDIYVLQPYICQIFIFTSIEINSKITFIFEYI